MTTLSESTGSPFTMSPLWRNPPERRSLPYLMELLAVLAAVCILMAFFWVVQGAVAQGERLRLAMAERISSTHLCNSLVATGAADTCLRQLNAPAKGSKD